VTGTEANRMTGGEEAKERTRVRHRAAASAAGALLPDSEPESEPGSEPSGLEEAPESGHGGHRERLRAKFLRAADREALDAIHDYELLELILFQAIPRRDVKPLAKALIGRFGSLGAVFSAPAAALMRVDGVKETTAVALKAVAAAALHMIREDVMAQPVLSSWDRLLDYCHASMAHRDTEQVRILFLDRKNRLLADELQQTGTVDHTPVYPREVVKRALECQASALILVHNHPSGDPQPSAADIDMTRRIAEACRTVGIILHDHVVIARAGYCSFKADGLL
jgi:DNA repair protein RadC